MSNPVLSAAVDNAATEAEWDALLEAMASDPGLKAEWSRSCAARDARDGVAMMAGRDFCGSVMAAIAQEAPLSSNVLPLRRAQPAAAVVSRPRLRSWRTLVPLSAAAGVVAAVLTVGALRAPNAGFAASSAASPLATTAVSFAPEAEATQADDGKAAILNAYLMEHSNSLAERSMGGTLANARFASRTADYRPDSP